MKKLILLLSTIYFVVNAQGIIPKPVSVEKTSKGSFTLSANSVIIVKKPSTVEAQKIASILSQKTGLKVAENGVGIELALIDSFLLPSNEAYILEVKMNGIFIKARHHAGLLYGIQSLYQLMPPNMNLNPQVKIPFIKITDYPRFGWRGLHMDVSRHFFDKAFIKKQLDLLVMLKMNVYHWHLTDDQGWRIEIKKYPKLTEMGAWRDDKRSEPWNYYQYASTPGQPKYGGFYTQEDIKEIVQYAADRNITVVPEIDLPGHSAAAIYAYNWLSCKNQPWTIEPTSPFEFSDPLCVCDDKVVEFTKDILSEVIALFPSKYIHIGGDECKHAAWENEPLCKKIMEKEGLKTTTELQARFNRQLESFIISKGRKMMGWDEILEGGIAPEAAVMSWRGMEGGIEAAKHKHPFVMASSTHLYFDMPQSESEFTSGWLRTLPLEKVYSFEPIPAELTPEEAKYMLGVEACLWTENMQTPAKVESQALPRSMALAEIAWSPKGTNNFGEFKKRLQNFFPILDQNGYNYFVPEPIGLKEKQLFIDKTEVNLKFNYPYGQIRYTTDGSEPVASSPLFTSTIIVTKPMTIKAKTFMPNGKTGRTISGEFSKGTLQTASIPSKALEKGITYKYYEGKSNSLKFMDTAKVKREGMVDKFIFPKDVIADGWGVDYTGFISVPTDGIYIFYTASDDGSELYINGNKIVDNDGVHGDSEKNGTLALKAGYHTIRVRYFEGNYGESLNVSWEGPSIKKGIIEAQYLFH